MIIGKKSEDLMGIGKRIIAALTIAVVLLFSAGCGGGGGGDDKKKGINMANFPLYVEDVSTVEYSEANFAEKRSQPYWYGNVMYNELSLPVSYADGSAYAKLLYTPVRVVSVMDQKLLKTYVEGTDYTVDKENKRLVIPEGSAIELLDDKAETGVNVPDGYVQAEAPDQVNKYVIWNLGAGPFVYTESSLFYGRYLSVTYAYDVAEIPAKDVFNKYDAFSLTTFRNKLESGNDVSVAVIGDSISEGSSSTGDSLHVAPNGPCYATQLKSEIERVYGVKVNLVNSAKGGTKSEWITSIDGAGKLTQAKQAKPDLCVIAYGMNDGTDNPAVTTARFGTNVEKAMNEILGVNENCEFILVNTFPCNPLYDRNPGTFARYLNKLNEVAANYEDGKVKVIDMLRVGNYMLDTKRFCEISSSNVNHPNDFFHRVYAMNIMSAIYDYKK